MSSFYGYVDKRSDTINKVLWWICAALTLIINTTCLVLMFLAWIINEIT